MKRRVFSFLSLLLCLLLLGACGFSLDSLLPEEKQLICRVTAKDGQALTVQVLSADSHYDEEELLIVRYHAISGGRELSVGDTITFTYDYLNDVTVQNDTPCIAVSSVTKTQWIPPETTQSTEAE
ncbi:MAG: hypothetical protein SOY32_02365 [Candidatus Faecousia sp.]|nr:hypothetical protein [Clostridiales bacterium]MDD7653041.1 hypothetical protein [Bacillota bacterium]MDY4219249.1 hypothetical protein [Candidatus Faecousia sp.]